MFLLPATTTTPALLLLLTTICTTSRAAWSLHGEHQQQSSANNNRQQQNAPPSTGEDWVTLAEGLEFQPSGDQNWNDPRLLAAREEAESRLLAGSSSNGGSYSPYSSSLFVDSQNAKYDGYQQAWRYMGFYIDCSTANGNNNNNKNNNNHRDLDEEGEEGDNQRDLHEDEGGYMGCTRYLLWAAYVDLGYEGGGIGEYMYYDRSNGEWNEGACAYGYGRCVKMDCHLPDTHFSLLGFFKHDSQAYGEWFGQVFKHEGYCIWDSDEYSFMQKMRENVPRKCKDSGYTSENGTALYYHLKPLPYGDITVGLYTDSACSRDYTGSAVTIATLGWDQDYIDLWNDYFGIYKICQPCTAYSLYYVTAYYERKLGEAKDKESGRMLDNGKGRKLGGGNGVFDCYDAAEYTNVNQCMKFYTKTTMYPASLADVGMAVNQGTTTYSPISAALSYEGQQKNAVRYASYVPPKQPVASTWFLSLSLFSLVCGAAAFYYVTTKGPFPVEQLFKEPLVEPTKSTTPSIMVTNMVSA